MDDRYNCSECKKTYKTLKGMKKHYSSVHEVNIQTVDKESIDLLIKEVKTSDYSCFGIETELEIEKYDGVMSEDASNKVKLLVEQFQKKNDVNDFFVSFYSQIVRFADSYFTMPRPFCVVFAKKLGDKIIGKYSRKYIKGPEASPQPISEKEMEGLKYLAGWVVFKLQRRAKKHFNNNVVKILECGITEPDEGSFIGKVNRGGLTNLKYEWLNVFRSMEEIFRGETCSTSKIDRKKMKKLVLQNTSVVTSFFSLIENDDLGVKILDELVTLYIKVRTFIFSKDFKAKKVAEKRAAFKEKALRKKLAEKAE